MSLAYRDAKTGRFISKRSASRRTKNLPTTERYEKRKRTDEQFGFAKTEKQFKENIRDVLSSVGLLKTDVDSLFEEDPGLTLDEAIDLALEEGFDVDLEDIEEFDLGLDLDIDLDKYDFS